MTADKPPVLVQRGATVRLSVHEVAMRAGVRVGFVEHLVQLGIVEPAHDAEDEAPLYPTEVTLHVRRLARLKADLGVNPEGGAIIVELLDRIDELEARLRQLERSRYGR